jgi:hypothetical protein
VVVPSASMLPAGETRSDTIEGFGMSGWDWIFRDRIRLDEMRCVEMGYNGMGWYRMTVYVASTITLMC